MPSSNEVGLENHKEVIEMVIPSFLDKIDYHNLACSPTRLIPKVYLWIIIKAEKYRRESSKLRTILVVIFNVD
jgi:hypothetical protein